MADQHLAPVCLHCKTRSWFDQSIELSKGYARGLGFGMKWGLDSVDDCRECQEKAEGYLTEIERLKRSVVGAAREITELQDQAAGDAVAYQRMAKRARKWKRRAIEGGAGTRNNKDRWLHQVEVTQRVTRERDEARSDLDAMTERHRVYSNGIASAIGAMRHVRPSGEPSRSDLEEIVALVLRVQDLIGERDEARSDLDALRVRARGMREDIITLGSRLDSIQLCAPMGGDIQRAAWDACKHAQRAAGEPIP